MRPQRLALSAFGPFAGEQTFDFGALGPHRLFLIHGPTGSGKTTLLDALCFALFGSSSGDERKPANLRSQHADAATATWVELDFAVGAAAYRIRRSPQQQVVGRGGRTVTQQPRITLWRRDGETLSVLAEQERPVRVAVEALLGYTEDEFRQVVVLPQGRFREVLTAAPGDRQAILATLFRTSLYRRIEEQIAARASEALGEAQRQEQHRATLLGEAGAATLEEAASLVATLAAERDVAEVERLRLRTAADLATARLAQARDEAARLLRASDAMARLDAMRGQCAAMDAERSRLGDARLAAATLTPDMLQEQAHVVASRRREEALQAAASVRTATARIDRAEVALGDEAMRLIGIDAKRKDAAGLGERARAALATEQARARATAAAASLEAAQARLAGAEADRETALGGAAVATSRHAEALRLVEGRETLGIRLQQARGVAEDIAASSGLLREIKGLEEGQRRSHATSDQAARALDSAVAARLSAEGQLRAHQAAHLAAQLLPGVPCPVCGSADHPAPQHPADAEMPDTEAAGAQEARARTRHASALDDARRADDGLTRAQDRLATLRARLPDLSAEEATARLRDLEAQSTLAEEAARRLPALGQDVARAGARVEVATTARTEATQEVRDREGELHVATGAVEALGAGAIEGDGGSALLAAAAEAAAKDAALATRRLDADRAELSGARAAHVVIQTQAADLTHRATEAAAVAARAHDDWLAACAEAGFADPLAAREARMAAPAMAEAASRLEIFDRDLAQAEALSASARAAAEGLTPPDLPGLEALDQASRLAAEAAAKQAGGLVERHRQAHDRLADIAKAEQLVASARTRHAMLRDVAEATSGRNARRLSLEGFVLASILDEALSAANHHLGRMLGGRYRVRRLEEPVRANAAVGLEIEVWDEWTGKVRPATTLSGGEGFCAALALALGLADTVQAHAGARRIDTLFIDEGFGSLDEDALDTAMDVLDGLQAGERLVGIISHVAELRARIPAQLIVRPGARGSSGRFVTPEV